LVIIGGRDHSRGREVQIDAQLAVVDNKSLQVVAHRSLGDPITSATLDDKSVYIALRDVGAIKVLSVQDLTESRQLFKDTNGGYLSVVGPLLLCKDGNEQSFEWFARTDLKPVKIADKRLAELFRRGVMQLDDTTLALSGVDYDLKTLKPVRLTEPYLTAVYSQRVGEARPGNGSAPPVMRFGAGVQGAMVMRMHKPPITLNDQGLAGAVVMPDMPCIASVSVEIGNRRTGGEGPQRISATLTLRDLVSGQQLGSLPLHDERHDQRLTSDISSRSQMARIVAGPGQLIVTVFDRMYRVDTAPFAALKPPMPLLLSFEQPTPVIGATPVTMQWEIAGGKSPVRYELINPVPGVKLDTDKAAVTIDPSAFAAPAAEQLLKAIINQRAGAGKSVAEYMQTYATRERERLRDLLGVEFKNIPVGAWINLRASDADNQTHTSSVLVFFDLPESALSQQIAEADKKSGATGTTTQPGIPAGVDLQQRIADLERENARLQGQVQLLTDLLQGRPPTTQPSR
jgi:hypothetical protein